MQWRPGKLARLSCVPVKMRQILLCRGSLSRHLDRRCHGGLRLELLSQRWVRPTRQERQFLCMGDRERAMLREVLLKHGTDILVYAHTVIPIRSLSSKNRSLLRLRQFPIGRLLFSAVGSGRQETEYALLPAPCFLVAACPELEGSTEPIWARRSIFRLRSFPLLVTEYFLPALYDFPHESGCGTAHG